MVMSSRAYQGAVDEIYQSDLRSRAREAAIYALLKCQEHDMSVHIARDIVQGLIEAMREEYGG